MTRALYGHENNATVVDYLLSERKKTVTNYYLMVATAEAVYEDRLQQAAQQRLVRALRTNRATQMFASVQQMRNLFRAVWQKLSVSTAANNPVSP